MSAAPRRPGRPRREPASDPIPELLPLHVTRLARQVTNREIAERSGLPLATVSGFFSGVVKDPATSTTIRIARALDVELSWVGAEALPVPGDDG
jgi:transcriptional regulator with XRE-family HTH domain